MKVFFLSVGQLFIPYKPQLSALLLGAVAVMAYAPFELSPLVLLSLAALFYLWLQAPTRKEGFKIGLWFGLGLFGLGVSWIFSSMYFYSGVMLPVAVLLTAIFVLLLSLFVGLAGWLALLLKRFHGDGVMLVVVLPAIWVAVELLRANVLGGYPFLLVGNTHIETWLAGYAPLIGVWGVSWAIAITAGILVWFYLSRAWLRGSIVLCLLWVVGGQLMHVEWVKPIAKPIDVALLQGNIPQDKKWTSEAFIPTLKSYVSLTKQNMDADLVVWPETAIPAYYNVVERGILKSFIDDAKTLNTDILVGVIAGDRGASDYYNALINLHNPQDRYYKRHLVPFSEFFPFHDAFAYVSKLFNIPFSTFSHGHQAQPALRLGGHLAGLSICYEMAFGDEIADQLPAATYFVTVSNDAWFAHTFEPAQQLQEVQMRALELGREIARSTNTGYTAIVDVKGKIKQQIPAYQTAVLRGEVQPYEGMTFYAQWGKTPVLFLLFMIFAFVLAKRYFLTGRVV